MPISVFMDLAGLATIITAIIGITVATKAVPLKSKHLALLIFLFTAGAMTGSLIVSDIYHIEPCHLCWWQRIFVYPMAFLSGASLVKKRYQDLFFYAKVLSVFGLIFSAYNIYIQTFPDASDLIACDPSNPCSDINVIAFDLITMPMMAAVVLAVVFACAHVGSITERNLNN